MRPGLVVAITIPLVLQRPFWPCGTWKVSGYHKVSLGSLIIALNCGGRRRVIAVEMMVLKLEEGYDKMRAATFAYERRPLPMLTSTLITAAGFLPMASPSRPARRAPSPSSR